MGGRRAPDQTKSRAGLGALGDIRPKSGPNPDDVRVKSGRNLWKVGKTSKSSRFFLVSPRLVQDLDRIWSGFGPDVDRIWTGGPALVWIWSGFGPDLDRIWSGFGPDLVRIWTGFGPDLVWISPGPSGSWSGFGPDFSRISTGFRPAPPDPP